MNKYFDNTMLKTYKECPRKFYFRHRLHWVREGLAPPLAFGLAWHEAMDVVWGLGQSDKSDREIQKFAMAAFLETWEEEGMPAIGNMDLNIEAQLAPRTPGIANEMLFQYIKTRRPFIQEVELLAIEQPFMVPIFDTSSDIYYIGRLDKVIKHRGRVIIPEHKTTTAYSKQYGFRSSFVDQWSPNSQVDGYLHAGHMLYGDRMKAVWIDAALVHKVEHDKFKFISVDRSTEMLDTWLYGARDWIERIQQEDAWLQLEKGEDALDAFPQNTESCFTYNRPCSYRDICRFKANPSTCNMPEGFKEDEWKPFDILGIDKLEADHDST